MHFNGNRASRRRASILKIVEYLENVGKKKAKVNIHLNYWRNLLNPLKLTNLLEFETYRWDSTFSAFAVQLIEQVMSPAFFCCCCCKYLVEHSRFVINCRFQNEFRENAQTFESLQQGNSTVIIKCYVSLQSQR